MILFAYDSLGMTELSPLGELFLYANLWHCVILNVYVYNKNSLYSIL